MSFAGFCKSVVFASQHGFLNFHSWFSYSARQWDINIQYCEWSCCLQ